MSELISFVDHPPLHEPVLVVALEGWIDAGSAAAGAMRTILTEHDSEPIAFFDTDQLLDHRARRPVMTITEGVMGPLTWPTIELRAVTDNSGRHVLLLVGAEPDHAWGPFVGAVCDAALTLGVTTVVGLGAYPAPVPHTRNAPLALTSTSGALVEAHPRYVRGTVEVPAGVQAAIEVAAAEAGISSMGLWAQVPHYISGLPYATASLRLIEGLDQVAGLQFETSTLEIEAVAGRQQLDELVAANDQHRAMVTQLEELYDSQAPVVTDDGGLGPLPTGDELAAEVQAFLRDQGD